VQEQVAGDLLPAHTPAERDAQVIATGFLALGPKGINERNRESYLLDIVDEQIENVSRAVLGLSVGCARCHDHKFDPITMTDYYGLAGIFRSSEARVGISNRQRSTGQPDLLYTLSAAAGSTSDHASPQLVADIKALEREWRSKLDELRRVREQAPAEVLAAVAAVTPINNPFTTPARAGSDPDKEFPELTPRTGPPPAPGSFEDLREKQQALFRTTRKLDALKEKLGLQTARGTAVGVADLPKPQDINVRLRGEADSLGPVAPRGFLTVVSVSNPPAVVPPESGRRQLADWLTRPDHPLTARVIVNRLWAKLFGAGIVPTVDDFGDQGQRPTNPELLDYLAVRFVEQGWSIKQALKELVLSRTYQLRIE
jgi:hypothetical protein